MPIIELFVGSRSQMRALCAEADDSPSAIDGYIDAGEVLVARREGEIVGYVQLIPSDFCCEIKSIAVLKSVRRQGIGTALVSAALEHARSRGCIQVVVSTAAAHLDNLRFYQRRGFRMERIERDVFTPERGYPALELSGISLRDRVWLSMG